MALTKYVAEKPPNNSRDLSRYLDAEFRKIQRVIDALAAEVERFTTPPTWAEFAFSNSWVSYDTTAYGPSGYTKDAFGRVTTRGLIKNGTVSQGILWATLPVGYRPGKRSFYICNTAPVVGTVQQYGYCLIEIQPNGSMTLYDSSASWTSVNGISFIAEN